MNDSEHELRDAAEGGDTWPDSEMPDGSTPQYGLDDLGSAAAARIRSFLAETTIRGGSSPSDVADLYTSQEIVDDGAATAYLDRRFVHGNPPADWRALQDMLSTLYYEGPPGQTAESLLERMRQGTARAAQARSIFDDPDEDELDEEDRYTRLEDRDPNLVDLEADARHEIERYIISDVLCYGVAPYKVMQLREHLRAAGDQRALQYLDLPFELGDRPADWDGLRDRALMARASLEAVGADPSKAYQDADIVHPNLDATELLGAIEERARQR